MFADAYERASHFTHPVIFSLRFFDDTIESSAAAFVIVNRDGWIVTAAHILEPILAHQQHTREIAAYNEQMRMIQQDPRLKSGEKKSRLRRLTSNSKWIKNSSYWWGGDGVKLEDIRVNPQADIAIGRLVPFSPDIVAAYPIFKRPIALRSGTSLCKLGFPFVQIQATFDQETGSFSLPPGTLPIARFPIEGIFTREILTPIVIDGRYNMKFLETSSPGLRGQSGGSIFDTRGVVWAIQSRTMHLDLGFNAEVIRNGRKVPEHQILNVGWGIHPDVLTNFLTDNSVSFALSED